LLSGVIADLFGLAWAIGTVGVLTFVSGLVVAVRMRETVRGTRRPNDTNSQAPEMP
jgi:uncharacterized BrkB/YihY/UPF0761 family membrane protein